jgi:hypothetical protein
MTHKKTLLIVLTIIFASCGGGTGTGTGTGVAIVDSATQTVANLANGFLLIPAIY